MIDETTEEQFKELLAGMQSVLPPVEFRLYYDENGKVRFYSCEDHEGNYIVIDRNTFAECRPDIRVIDGVIHKSNEFAIVSKLERSSTGTTCAIEDVSIIVDNGYKGMTQIWETEIHEYKYS